MVPCCGAAQNSRTAHPSANTRRVQCLAWAVRQQDRRMAWHVQFHDGKILQPLADRARSPSDERPCAASTDFGRSGHTLGCDDRLAIAPQMVANQWSLRFAARIRREGLRHLFGQLSHSVEQLLRLGLCAVGERRLECKMRQRMASIGVWRVHIGH
jgi:hypothetical protein